MTGTAKSVSATVGRQTASAWMLVPVLMLAVSANALQAGMPKVPKHESRHEIDQLEQTWRNAILSQNTEAMDSLLADDYMAITPAGTIQTKDQTLSNLRARRIHLTALDITDRKVRFYGTTAVVTSLAEVQGTNVDGDVSGSFRYTRVYVRDSRGDWKIVSFEASRIREPGWQK